MFLFKYTVFRFRLWNICDFPIEKEPMRPATNWSYLIYIVLLTWPTNFFDLQELTKFINQCNEIKAANLASKEGGDLNIVKADGDQSKSK